MVHFIAAQVFDHEINVTIQPLALKEPSRRVFPLAAVSLSAFVD